jgi:ribose transport system substrate-binding protein
MCLVHPTGTRARYAHLDNGACRSLDALRPLEGVDVRRLNHRTIFERVAFGAMSILMLAGVAACSSSSKAISGTTNSAGSSSTAASGAASSAGAAAFSRKVAADVARLQGAQSTPPPADGPKAVPGKTIDFVVVQETDASTLRVVKGLEAAADTIGWQHTTYNANGSPVDANKDLQQAVTTKPDAIVMLGLSNTQTASGLAAAQAAHIPVGCVACWDESTPDPKGVYAAIVPTPSVFTDMGYGVAEYAYQQANGKPKFLTFNDPSQSNLAARGQGFDKFMSECKAAGGDCSVVSSQLFQVQNVTTTLAAQAASAAQAHPDFNAVWSSFDSAAAYVMSGLRQAGKLDASSFLVGENADPASLAIIQQNGYQKATIGISSQWAAWAVIDSINRVFAGAPVVDENVPIRLFDSANVAQANNGLWTGDVDFEAAYKKIWGK